jgi:MFS family permease
VYPKNSTHWSGSAYCDSQQIVLQEAVKITGTVIVVNKGLGIFATLVLGPLVDSWGRKKLMVLSCLGYATCCLLLYIHAWVADRVGGQDGGSLLLLLVAVGIASGLNVYPVAAKGMAADLTKRDDAERSYAMTWYAAAKSTGTLVGFGGGYFVLRMCLEEYKQVWLLFTIVCTGITILAWLFLQETLFSETKNATLPPAPIEPLLGNANEDGEIQGGIWRGGIEMDISSVSRCSDALERDSEGATTSVACGSALKRGGLLILRDRFLSFFLLSTIIFNVAFYGAISTVSPFLIGVIGYSQATASLIGVFMPIASILGYVVSGFFLVPRLGNQGTNAGGKILVAVGLVLVGYCDVTARPKVFFWLGWETIAIGLGLVMPSQDAIISMRVGKHDQGKVVSLAIIAVSIGVIIGAAVWSSCLYNSRAKSLEAGRPFFWSAAVSLVSVGVHAASWWHYERAKRERNDSGEERELNY